MENIEKNNPTISFNILYVKKKEICAAYTSKINSNCKNQIILFIIPNDEKEGWHHLPVKRLSALLHGTTSKHDGNFQCLDSIHSFRTKNKTKSH